MTNRESFPYKFTRHPYTWEMYRVSLRPGIFASLEFHVEIFAVKVFYFEIFV